MKTLMEEMNLRNRSSFVNTHIITNLTEGYITILYPESLNHPMQSYYLTNRGREVLNRVLHRNGVMPASCHSCEKPQKRILFSLNVQRNYRT